MFRFDWFFGEEELIGAELNKMNGVIISGVNPFTRLDTFNKIFTTGNSIFVRFQKNKGIHPHKLINNLESYSNIL